MSCRTDLGTESVSGALSSLQQCDPRDSFDMFAQTRGSNSEPRKTYAGTLGWRWDEGGGGLTQTCSTPLAAGAWQWARIRGEDLGAAGWDRSRWPEGAPCCPPQESWLAGGVAGSD